MYIDAKLYKTTNLLLPLRWQHQLRKCSSRRNLCPGEIIIMNLKLKYKSLTNKLNYFYRVLIFPHVFIGRRNKTQKTSLDRLLRNKSSASIIA